MQNWVKGFAAAAMVAALMAGQPAYAVGGSAADAPSATAMGMDVLLVRPLSLVATVAGTGLFIISLPFSALGRNTDEAAEQLILRPGKYTFVRPLGEFNDALSTR
ncbi:MAG: multidrug transporter [Salinisphaeraceae bacterium]|jgi:hypothetical protein|nr:multidrug transporter [Salinisphaeraceae bacterium]